MTLQASVIVPVVEGWSFLGQILDGYAEQSAPAGSFEVIVCDTTGRRDLADAIAEQATASNFPLRHVEVIGADLATARAHGARVATAPLLIIATADALPHRDLVAAYIEATEPDTVLFGAVDWSRAAPPTPFSRFLASADNQSSQTAVDLANLALPRDLLSAASNVVESGDLLLRIQERGARFKRVPNARLQRLQPPDLREMLRQSRVLGALRATPDPADQGAGDLQQFYRATLDYMFALGLAAGLREQFGDDWPATLDQLVANDPTYAAHLEQQTAAATAYSAQLHERIAVVEEAVAALREHQQTLERAQARANPVRRRLRQVGARLTRARELTTPVVADRQEHDDRS